MTRTVGALTGATSESDSSTGLHSIASAFCSRSRVSPRGTSGTFATALDPSVGFAPCSGAGTDPGSGSGSGSGSENGGSVGDDTGACADAD
eukprot:COSAG05_NODE_19955_length_285_cov_0.709677_1_plen_90_part_01